jgi:hypothetical protein
MLHNLSFILNEILKVLVNNVQKLKYQSKRLLNVTSKNLMVTALYVTMWTLALIKQEEQGGFTACYPTKWPE